MMLFLFIVGCIIITILSNTPSKRNNVIQQNVVNNDEDEDIEKEKDDDFIRVTRMTPEERFEFLQKRDELIAEHTKNLTNYYNNVFDTYFYGFKEYEKHFIKGTLDELDEEIKKDYYGGLLDELLNDIVHKMPKKELIPKIMAYLTNNLEQYLELFKKMQEFSMVVFEYENIIYRDTYILGFAKEDKFLQLDSEEVSETYNHLIVLKCEACVLNELLLEYDKRHHYQSYEEYKKETVYEELFGEFINTVISVEIK